MCRASLAFQQQSLLRRWSSYKPARASAALKVGIVPRVSTVQAFSAVGSGAVLPLQDSPMQGAGGRVPPSCTFLRGPPSLAGAPTGRRATLNVEGHVLQAA